MGPFWVGAEPTRGWSWTFLSGIHGQPRRDLDADGWTDLPYYLRGAVRPRVFYESGGGTTLFVTGGLIAENREGGTFKGQVAP